MKKASSRSHIDNGLIELTQMGNHIGLSNLADCKKINQLNDDLARKYPEIKNEIDDLVTVVRSNIEMADPEDLINYLISMNYFVMLNKSTESEFTAEENFQLRTVEYVQSVMVSTKISPRTDLSRQKREELFETILRDTIKIYEKMYIFYMSWVCKEQYNSNLSSEMREYILVSQLASQIRGTQYQNFRIDILQALLQPHNAEIKEAYGINVEEIIQGLVQLEKNLSTGRLDAMNKMADLMECAEDYDYNIGNLPDDFSKEASEAVSRVVGLELYDVKNATNWPMQLIDDITYDAGGNADFFTHEEFAGWPIWNLPVQAKPCIRINGRVYAFDYYSVFDNFYRVLQKSVVKHTEGGNTQWKDIQAETSERLVEQVFLSLLPGCSIYRNNYYPNGKRNSAENDLLVKYKDTLIVIEVKAGSFTYTPAITDFVSHKKSLETLVEKAEAQCLRVKSYIENNESAIFYKGNDLKSEKFRINQSDLSQIYMLDVTIADFNELAAQMEKIQIANVQQDIITISLNDLWVYKEYFNDPCQFIHFLKQRTIATRTKEISVLDELDHLGLYIEHNMYSIQARELGKGGVNVSLFGYREPLDKYFACKQRGEKAVKPMQKLPSTFTTLLSLCENKEKGPITHFTNFLLDMADDSRRSFCEQIQNLSRRQAELGRMVPLIAFGELSYCLYIRQPGIQETSRKMQREYVLATLAQNKNPYCYLIQIENNSQAQIVGVEYEYLTQHDITVEKKSELMRKGIEYAERRKISYMCQTGKRKIGRNELCPCGSGKKYKRCCGR